jgi:glycosyltransferase involved in cell wall biosynthesis
MAKLVSVITPCYNGEKFVYRLLDSILAQTYPLIEYIFINDGSTDGTERIVRSYIPRFEERGYRFIYVDQENQGLTSSINNALKLFTGDYLAWPDSDDFWSSAFIEECARFLEEHPEHGIVRTNGIYTRERGNVLTPYSLASDIYDLENEHCFEDCLCSKLYNYPIGYLARSHAFLKHNPERTIYCPKHKYLGGQNYQILLPLFYYYKCGYVNKILFTYVSRKDSKSHQKRSLEQWILRFDSIEDSILHTIGSFDGIDLEKYAEIVHAKYNLLRWKHAYQFRNKELTKKYYLSCKEKNIITIKRYAAYLAYFYCYPLYSLGNFIWESLKELKSFYKYKIKRCGAISMDVNGHTNNN